MLGLPSQLPTALRVLIADPHRAAAVSMALFIRQCGHSARAVFSTLEALETAREYRPNVILIDHQIGPVLSTYELAKRLRQEPGCRPIAVMALADYGEGNRDDSGFDLWLDRPVDPAGLARLLTEASSHRARRPENTLF